MDTWRSRPQEAEAEAGPASGESSSGGQAPGGGGSSSLLGEIRDEFGACDGALCPGARRCARS